MFKPITLTDEMLPEVREFINALDRARSWNEEEYNKNGGRYESLSLRNKRVDKHEQMINDAWDSLAKSEHPIVRWIGSDRDIRWDNPSEAKIALQAIRPTTTLADLDAVARSNGWCPDYRMYRDRAVRDGVFPSRVEMSVNNGPWHNLNTHRDHAEVKVSEEILTGMLETEGVDKVVIGSEDELVTYRLVK